MVLAVPRGRDAAGRMPGGTAADPPARRLAGRREPDDVALEGRLGDLNAYYRGVSPKLPPGGRLEAPLASFVTGLGQRFNTAREHISRVEVRATDAAGKPVVLDWDEKTGPPLVQEGQ